MRGSKDKVAIVTRGRQGIGRAVSRGLAEERAKVAICDLKLEADDESAALIKTHALDVGDQEAVNAAITRIEADLGPIRALVGGWGTASPVRHGRDKRACEIRYLDEQYTARQALEMGLFTRVVPAAELDAAVDAWTDMIRRTLADRAGAREALVRCGQRKYPRHQPECVDRGDAVLRHRAIEGRRPRLYRKADARLPQLCAMGRPA